MGLFNFFKKPKSDLEQYYEDRKKKEEQETAQNISYEPADNSNSYIDPDFRITVEDVFTITGRGTVIVGTIESGTISTGDVITLKKLNGTTKQVTVTGIEMFRKMMDVAHAGDNVGLLLRGVSKSDISRGDFLYK